MLWAVKTKSRSGAKGAYAVMNIKGGGVDRISPSQWVVLNISLPDARKWLNRDCFLKVQELYDRMRLSTVQYEMDYRGYEQLSYELAGEFESHAPYLLIDGFISSSINVNTKLKIVRMYKNGRRLKDMLAKLGIDTWLFF